MATVADGTLGPAAGHIPVTILATLAALTPRALLARAGTFSPWREAEGHADRAPGVPKGLAMPPQLTSPFAQVPEQLHPEARRPERAQRPPGARFAPSSSHAPSWRCAGATGCPREPRHRPPGSPGEPAGLAGWPRPRGWVTAGSGLRPDPEPRTPPIGGVSRLGERCDGFVIYINVNIDSALHIQSVHSRQVSHGLGHAN